MVDDRVEWVVASDLDGTWAIVTNGKDTPRVWDGGAGTNFETWDSDSAMLEGPFAGFWTCKTLAEHYGRLLLGNITSADYSPNHVLFSNVGKFSEWWETGSGVIFFSRAVGGIQKLMAMGDRVGVFADDSVDVMVLVGGEVLYATDHVIDGTRLVSGAAVVDLGPWVLFMGERNFYLFDGTRMVRPVGDKIAKGYRGELNEELRERAWAFHDPAHQRVYWGVPTLDQDEEWVEKIYLLRYDVWEVEDHSWSPVGLLSLSTISRLAWGFSGGMRRWPGRTSRRT